MRTLVWFLSLLLLVTPAFAAGQKRNQFTTTDQVKMKIAKLGLGEKAKATITTRDGLKTRGYVYSASEEDFVMRDRKSGASATIRYADVTKIENGKGLSSLSKGFLIAVTGIGAAFTAVYYAIAGNEW